MSFLNFVSGYVDDATADAVASCEAVNERHLNESRAAEAAFRDSLNSLFTHRPGNDCSRITELITNLTESGTHRLVIAVSDLIDNPRADIHRVSVPAGEQLVLILARPKPSYASVQDGLARAAQWEKIAGVTIVRVAELNPDLWASVRRGMAP